MKTLKYILLIIGILALVAGAALYLKPELLNTFKAKVFPNRVVDEEEDLGAGTVVYENEQGVDIAITNSDSDNPETPQELVQILYQDTVAPDAEPVTFSGVFEEYGTGCFADGECYAIVDGKHVTTILGWAGGPVGLFENPDIAVGTEVEVYALPTESGKYTLYGSKEYYIKEK